jgi:peptide/nickel transport system permease protein
MNALQKSFRELLRYPSAIAGLVIIALLLALSVYAVLSIPYSDASRMWRGGEEVWYQNPKTVPPEWINLFRRSKLPRTLVLNSADSDDEEAVTKTVDPKADSSAVTIDFFLEYPYDAFPQELILYFDAQYADKLPFASAHCRFLGNRLAVLPLFAGQQA